MKKINGAMVYVPIDNITELNDTFFVRAAIVTKKLVKTGQKEKNPHKKEIKKESA